MTTDTGYLDWLCIGAQKAGTSTLFRLLQEHPEIFVPPSKEDPLFDRPVTTPQVTDYMVKRFRTVAKSIKCGTVTPQYMISVDIAERVHTYLPDARIIAILRNPIYRAFSHYQMATRKSHEGRSFDEAVRSQISQLEAGHRPEPHDDTEAYVWRGCYATLLKPWFEQFDRSQILVVLTDDLEKDPVQVMTEIQKHLGITVHAPTNPNLYSNVAPPTHRLSILRTALEASLRRLHVLKLIPTDRRLRYAERLARLERRLSHVAPAKAPSIDDTTLSLLKSFYYSQNRQLESLLDRTPIWN